MTTGYAGMVNRWLTKQAARRQCGGRGHTEHLTLPYERRLGAPQAGVGSTGWAIFLGLRLRRNPMDDEQLADLHRFLAEYHRRLAKEAILDVVQQYHSDLAQRLADEAALIPRRTAIAQRLREGEQRIIREDEE
jgi:hypothetical protein